MDPLEEFLSPEALRLLLDSDDFATTGNEPSVTTSDQSLSIITPLAAGVNIPISDESKPIRKRPALDANIAGCSTLVLDKAGSVKPKRAKFSAEGRAKVASVRKKGACMKCHLNKLPCSGEWPCESCCRSRAVIAGRASRHRWMDCVPFSMKDLDIFAGEIVQNNHLLERSRKKLLEFTNRDYWHRWNDLRGLTVSTESDANDHYVEFELFTKGWWISGYHGAASIPVDRRLGECFHSVGAICCIAFLDLMSSSHGIDNEVMLNAQCIAGSRVLQCLEKVLSTSSLSNFGADTLRALISILGLTMMAIYWSSPRVQSCPEFFDKQHQLLRVLAHHAVYIGERVDVWKGLEKERIIRTLVSSKVFTLRYGGSAHDGHGKAESEFGQEGVVLGSPPRDDPLGEVLEAKPSALDPWRGDTSQTTLYTEAKTVYEQGNDRAIIQRNEVAKSAYLPDPPPEDRYRTFDDFSQIDPTISTTAAGPLPEQQPDAVCGCCGSLQIFYKPSQDVISCDDCFTPYQPNDSALAGWDLGQPRSTDQSLSPAGRLDTSRSELGNHASWPDLTTSSSYGNDIDDFSWFMAS